MAKIIKADATKEQDAPLAAALSLSDFAAEARQVVLDARKEAARIVAEARGKAETDRRLSEQRGYEEGFARGQNDGYADGERTAAKAAGEKFRVEFDALLEVAGKVTEELSAARADLLHQARGRMLDLALEVARKIVGHAAVMQIAAARENLAKVLKKANPRGELTVKVNPDQLEPLKAHCAELIDLLGVLGEVRVVGDEAIGAGGVKLLAREGEIDATIRTQLANVIEALTGAEESPRNEPNSQGTYEPSAAEMVNRKSKIESPHGSV